MSGKLLQDQITPRVVWKISYDEIKVFNKLASSLSYASSHFYIINFVCQVTTQTDLANEFTTYDWKLFFDCIHYEISDAVFDELVTIFTDQGDYEVLACMAAGYIAALLERQTEQFNARIKNIFKYLDGKEFNDSFKAVTIKNHTLFSFVMMSGNWPICKCVLQRFSDKIVCHANFITDKTWTLGQQIYQFRFYSLYGLMIKAQYQKK